MNHQDKPRLPYADNLRALIVILVVFVHAACTYSAGMGRWYYVEQVTPDAALYLIFGSFLALAQSFDMSFLFMLAGYFVPPSLDTKGPARFMKDRLYRLGIPLLIYISLIHPIAVKLSHPDINLGEYLVNGLKSLSFLGWSGPLWFVFVLLVFSGIYTLVSMLWKTKISVVPPKINMVGIAILTAIIAIPAFLIRLTMPVGGAVLNLQFPYFSGYIVMFVVGVLARRMELFERIDYETGRRWLRVALSYGLASLGLISVFGGVTKGKMYIFGGPTWQAFAYALWEAFSCVAIAIGLIGIFRNRFNRQNRFQKFLSDHCFGVYVFHPPILIAICMAMQGLMIHPLIKFLLAAPCAVMASYLFTFVIRKNRQMKKIFS